jgi:biotin operon repressor
MQLTPLAEKILVILRTNDVVSREQLESVTGASDRVCRGAIEELRAAGHLVISMRAKSGSGYSLNASKDAASESARLSSIAKSYHNMQAAFDRRFPSTQATLFPEAR